MPEWRDNPLFANVDLEDTWILGWAFYPTEHRLEFEVELSLWPGHPDYQRPAPNRHTCYRTATLIFEGVEELRGLHRMSEVAPTVEAGGADYGSFDGCALSSPNQWTVDGAFGHVTFTCASATLQVRGVVDDT